jgi:NitT/TauT family transport system substrate-binding protein
MGMVKLMKDNKDGVALNNYEFTIEAAADSLAPLILQGKLDIAAVPTNLASVLYNKSKGKIKLLAVNTLGVLYIVNRGEALTMADLKGKTLYATGKGAVPEYALKYVLSQNGIDPEKDVKIEWKSQPDEVVAVLATDNNAIAMLPQPYVTVAQTKIEGLKIALDLTKEWDNLDTDSRLITGTLAVRAEFAEQHPQLVENFLNEYKASTEFVNANVEQAATLVEEFGIVKAAVAKVAIPYCNIVFISGNDMKAPVTGYLNTVLSQNPDAVGGSIPGDDFYYSK